MHRTSHIPCDIFVLFLLFLVLKRNLILNGESDTLPYYLQLFHLILFPQNRNGEMCKTSWEPIYSLHKEESFPVF